MILDLAWSQVRSRPSRLVAVVVAVAVATALLAATATFAATSTAGLRLTAAAPLTTADIVLDADSSVTDPHWYRAAEKVLHVDTVDPLYAQTVDVFGGSARGTANVQSIPATAELRWFRLASGRWPASATEVGADRRTLDALGVRVGDTLTFRRGDGDPFPVTIVGAADLGFKPLTGTTYRFYAAAPFFGASVPQAALLTGDAARLAATVEDLNRILPPGTSAMSASRAADEAAARFAGGSTQLALVLLAFALVALLAAVLVIANTLHLLVAQRARQTALLRLVGAHRAQVRRVVLAEATLIGSAGAVIGAAGGVGLGRLGAGLLGTAGGGLRVHPLVLILCVLVGVGATVVAAWAPARRAMRAAPVGALQELPSAKPRGRGFVLGLAATAAGVVALAGSVVTGSLALALGGGLGLAGGLLAVLPRLVVRALPPVAALLERCGVAAGLAGGNLSRNARRTAAGTMSVVLGAALVTALAVAAASGRATVDADLEARYPVAVSVHTDGGRIADATVTAIAALPALTATAVVGTAPARFPAAGRPTPTLLAVLPPDLAGRLAPVLTTGGGPPVILLPAAYLRQLGVADGATISIDVGRAAHRFTARASRLSDTTGRLLGIVNASAVAAFDLHPTPTAVWGVAPAGFDRALLADRVAAIAAGYPDIEVGGGVAEGRDLADVLSLLLGLSLAMLASTVLIALIGLANLLGLGVVERRREIALLRALGTRRGRLRGILAIEAVTITLLGTLIGIVIGAPVGLAAVSAAVSATADPVVRLPWGQLALVVAAAVVTGVLASLGPARRAARVAPAAGLTR